MENTNILVADDNAAVVKVMQRALGGGGTRVAAVSDGASALERAIREMPDLVILDVRMPGMDGYGVCRALREDPRTCNIPILIVTGTGGEAGELHGLGLGADDYLQKPLDMLRFKARVDTLLRRSRGWMGVNPLTRLPGNRAIARETERRLRAGRPFIFTYADIRRFKEFNDLRGFADGDKLIMALADILRGAAGPEDFLGHIGGDDFVLITEQPVDEDALRAAFEAQAFSFSYCGAGWMTGPGTGLTLGQLRCELGSFIRSYDDVAQAATALKESRKAV